MATFKSIEPTAENVRQIQISFQNADSAVQEAHQKIDAVASAINLIVKESVQSPEVRNRLEALCDVISDCAFRAMNDVNSEAETWGANFKEVRHG